MSGDSDWTDKYANVKKMNNDFAQYERFGQFSPKEVSLGTTGYVETVDSPSHYTNGKIEAIDYFEDNMPVEAIIGALEYQVKKYMHRWRYKGKPLEDLKKAQWNLNRLITKMEGT